MTLDELKERLDRFEWSDIEFKAAQRQVPRDAYRTVSAFANTSGGHLVFGIEEQGNDLRIVGVIDVDNVQNDFLSTLRSGQLLNRVISVQESALEDDEGVILVFYVPESPRREKPVYLNGDIRQTRIRRGAGDERCTPAEIERFLRDASASPFDGETISNLRAEDFYDEPTVSWYRRIFQQQNANRHADLNDVEFLHELGYVQEHEDELVPTRAGVLLFGAERNVRQVLCRATVDYQRHDRSVLDAEDEARWDDRTVIEQNLIQAWQTLLQKYAQIVSLRFELDASTLRRSDDPPDLTTFRESVVNLLVHQDFGDARRMPTLKIFQDETQLFNPGDSFSSISELLDPGEKEVRNPTILTAFRRIGLVDQAGSGIRAIFREWRNLGFVPPMIENDKSAKSFRLILNRTELISEEQRLFQSQLGVRLSQEEARIFAALCQSGSLELLDAKRTLAKPEAYIRQILDRLVTQQLIDESSAQGPWTLKEHLRDSVAGLIDQPQTDSANLVTPESDQASDNLVTPESDQVNPEISPTRPIRSLSAAQRAILLFCDVPQRQEAIMEHLEMTHRTHFRNRHLRPLLKANLIQQTHPESPTHPSQAYVVTSGALDLVASLQPEDE